MNFKRTLFETVLVAMGVKRALKHHQINVDGYPKTAERVNVDHNLEDAICSTENVCLVENSNRGKNINNAFPSLEAEQTTVTYEYEKPFEQVETGSRAAGELDRQIIGNEISISVSKSSSRDIEKLRVEHKERMAALKKEAMEKAEERKTHKEKLWEAYAIQQKSFEKNREIKAVAELKYKEGVKKYRKDLKNIIKLHERTLRLKYSQLTVFDEYGLPHLEKWFKEREYFIRNIIDMKIGESHFYGISKIELEAEIDKVASESIDVLVGKQEVEEMTGVDYEIYCSTILKQAGWNAIMTPGSGDQGVDIIADCAHRSEIHSNQPV